MRVGMWVCNHAPMTHSDLAYLVVQHRHRVPVPAAARSGADWQGAATARQFDAALMSVGFKLSAELLERLSGLDEAAVAGIGARTLETVREMVGDHVRRAAKRAGVGVSGAHRLRHTFCSHLAMRGAPARAIQELAGHQDLSTTQRYMHLSPAALDAAIRLLDGPRVPYSRGDILETADR